MADYNKIVNFAAKDALATGNPNKKAKGTEVDNEFNAIAVASATKIDKVPAAVIGNVAAFAADGSVVDGGLAPGAAPNFPNVTGPTSVTQAQLDVLTASGLTLADLQKLADTNASAAELNDLAGNAVSSADFTKLSQITVSASQINTAAGAPGPISGYNAKTAVYIPNNFPAAATAISSGSVGGGGADGTTLVTIPNMPAGALADVELVLQLTSITGTATTSPEIAIEASGPSGGFVRYSLTPLLPISDAAATLSAPIFGTSTQFRAQVFKEAGTGSTITGNWALSYRVARIYN